MTHKDRIELLKLQARIILDLAKMAEMSGEITAWIAADLQKDDVPPEPVSNCELPPR